MRVRVCVFGFVEVPFVSWDKRQRDSIGFVQERSWVYTLGWWCGQGGKKKRKVNGSVHGSSGFEGASVAAFGGP